VTTRFISMLAVGALALAACGDGDAADDAPGDAAGDPAETSGGSVDGTSGAGVGGLRAEAARLAVEAAAVEGLELDGACVDEFAAQLTDDDARALVDAGIDGDPVLSAEGNELTAKLLTCVDEEALVDLFVDGLEQSGEAFDEACVRENLDSVDLSAALGEDETPRDLLSAVVGCVDLGG
jgi:hypothetical protein